MNYIEIILGTLGVAAAAGGLAAWYKRSEGKDTVTLAQSAVQLYKDKEAVYIQQIAELNQAISLKNDSIKRQQDVIKTMVKEFKDYKNGN